MSIQIVVPFRYSTMNRSSALSTTRCLLILLVAVQNHFYHASANTVNSSTTTCESNQAIRQVDLLTDWWPREISWGVVDITNPSPSMAVLSSDVYSGSETFYSYLYCLDRSNCYEFTMNDSWGDGICCSSWGIGEYTVFYDNDITILQKVASLEDLKRQFDLEMDVLTSRHQLLWPLLCPQSCPLLHPLMCLP